MDTKKWYASKTIWGSIFMLVALILSGFGYTLNADDQITLADIATAIGGAVGVVLTIIGRVTASKKITM